MRQAVAGPQPGMDAAAVLREQDAELVSPAYSRYSNLVVERAQGAHLYTVGGRDVLDFGCGIGVTNLGHGHPRVVAAVHEQVDKLWHTSVTSLHPQLIKAAQKLVEVSPDALNQAFFCNSGAEAVEAAIKLSRRHTGRTDIIAFRGAFHGRTYGALSLTASNARYHHKVGPFLPGVHHVRYPYCLRFCSHGPDEPCPIASGEEIRRLFLTHVAPDDVAAIFVEPIQGEGGYIVPPDNFLPTLREICDEHGIMLVVDEVQSGFGRTGRMFAVEYTGIQPDIMCVAKGMGNGLPIAAIVARHSVMRSWLPGEHGTTFGGNPVACAAAIAVIDTMVEEKIPERAARLGAAAMERLRAYQKRQPALADVRGRGLMIGLEFMPGGKPLGAEVEAIAHMCVSEGLLVLTCGPDHNVIRLVPPLTISEEDLNAGLDILERAADAILK